MSYMYIPTSAHLLIWVSVLNSKLGPISTSDDSHACYTRIYFEINYAIDTRYMAH